MGNCATKQWRESQYSNPARTFRVSQPVVKEKLLFKVLSDDGEDLEPGVFTIQAVRQVTVENKQCTRQQKLYIRK